MTAVSQPASDTHTAEALSERVFAALIETSYLGSIHIGREVGLYAALRDHGAQTSEELAERTGTDERYVREWLEHQAGGDNLTVDYAARSARERRNARRAGNAEALLDTTSPCSWGRMAQFGVGVMEPIAATIEAFRSGSGVAYDKFVNGRLAQADFNRPSFV